MSPPNTLHFAELIGAAMLEEPDFYARLCNREATAVAKVEALWQQEELPVHLEISRRFRAKYDIKAAEAEAEGWRWAQAGFRPFAAMQWAAETTSPLVARALADRGWTPRLHHAYMLPSGAKIASELEQRKMAIEQIPPPSVGEAARKRQRARHR